MRERRRREWLIPFARSLTRQTTRKSPSHKGCGKIGCSPRCAPWHRSPGYDLRRAPYDHPDFTSNALSEDLFSASLNPVFPTLPLGTLAANLIGGLLVGIAVEYFHRSAILPPETRLFAITGFLGGLTTFSTFSAETVTLILREQYHWAGILVFAHVAGSLAMTILGIMAIKWLAQH
jgi:CrcB protein